MERTYLAVAAGIIHDDKGTINRPIARDPKNRLKMSVQPNGREAITNYTVLERYKNHTLVEVSLHTGRTHQIRVHFASINRPILGDTLYGAEKQSYGLTGQLLHAKSLGLTHPNGEHMRFEAPPPDVFNKTIKKLEMSHVR
jgi:23S rRNA pseudouridine1911/1915/1917 synthase